MGTQDKYGAAHGAGVLALSSILEDLVRSNTVLTKSNADLTETTVKLTKIIDDLTGQLKITQGNTRGGGRENRQKKQTTHSHNCRVDRFHKPDDCFELVKNKAKHPAAWETCL